MKTLNKKLRTTHIFTLLTFVALIPISSSHALSSYGTTWNNLHANSTSGTNASCQLCHAASTQNLNSYGQELCISSAGSISNRIQAVEALNSDADPTGSSNLTEATANTQPGWTPGNVNPTYSRGNCSATGVVESPPTFIAGDLDPVSINQPPVASASGPYSGTVNVPLSFDGSASTDADGIIVSYSWSFGDGNTGTGVSPTHTYLADGTFNVTLIVTDDIGDTGSNTTTATVGLGNQPPVANVSGPYAGTVNMALSFDGTASSDPDGTIISYSWDFGDGTTGTGATPTHTYAVANTYNVILTVVDDANATDSVGTTANIVPANQLPVANAKGPYTGTVNVALTFDGTASSDVDGTIISYSWDFGDGTSGVGATPSHAYAASGNYTVTLVVTDDQGATGSTTTTASIGAVNQPPVSVPNGLYSGIVGTAISFDATGSTDADGTIVAYDWDFGDGTTGTGVSVNHAYTMEGSFNVILTVTDDAGDTGTASTTAVIGLGNLPPVANPNGPYMGTVGVAVMFDGTGSNDPDGMIDSYSWNFGDGNVGSGLNPGHTYMTQGTYNVTLQVTDNAGATDSAMTTVKVSPVATGDADVFLLDLESPSDLELEIGESKSKEIEVEGDGDTIMQDATVSLSVTSLAGVSVDIYQQAITKTVSPNDDETTEYEFQASITCHATGSYDLAWSATISAAENNDIGNDTLTGSTRVSCEESDDDHDSDDDDDDDDHDSDDRDSDDRDDSHRSRYKDRKNK